MTNKTHILRTKPVGRFGALCLAAVLVSACGGTEDDNAAATGIKVNSAADIAQTSADNYNDNVNGIITGATLKRWKDDWINQRPAGITGKLVILQMTAGPAGAEYVKGNATNVFTYLVPSGDWTQTRSNGVITTQSMVINGPTIDSLLQKHNIDPTKDMIVCAQGASNPPGNGNAMAQGRCWYTLRYWGVSAEHLALLNGSNDWQISNGSMVASDFDTKSTNLPNTPGTFSVTALKTDNTVLQATLQDMLAILPASDTNDLSDGVFIWDARSVEQYSGGETAGDGGGIWQNNSSRQGHPWGALQLNFNNLLVSGEGARYKDKADLASYLEGNVVGGKGFVDATYQGVGLGNAYQPGDTVYTYCETTMRAMITGIASAVVLGKPTRFYDGAMIEWSSLSHMVDATGNYLLPSDSPWRTDIRSHYVAAASPALVAPRAINDPYAPSANAIVREDRLYKLGGGDVGTGDGGGVTLPANPCG
jgi:thiosulfate/3-mercaptopyruvate sulfurtransferase